MIVPQRIIARYAEIQQYLSPLRDRVRQTINPFSDRNGFAISSRVKSLESLAEKIETGRFKGWHDIDDLVAFTVVIPKLSDESKVLGFLGTVFETVEVRKRGDTRKAPDVFRFDSTIFIGRLRAQMEGVEVSTIETIKFEVQTKSAFEHAWAVTTHALTYKAPIVNWRRLRLSAQLKAAVEQLDLLVLAFEDAALHIEESSWPEIEAKRRLTSFFQMAVEDGRVPEELAPKDWSRFCDNAYRLGRAGNRTDRTQPHTMVDSIQTAISNELALFGPEAMPRSISLWQFTFGVLSKYELIAPPLDRFWPIITPELEAVYPNVSKFESRFDYSRGV